MKELKIYKLMYFEGFVGTSFIVKDEKVNIELTFDSTRRISETSKPDSLLGNYFVEKDFNKFALLEESTIKRCFYWPMIKSSAL